MTTRKSEAVIPRVNGEDFETPIVSPLTIPITLPSPVEVVLKLAPGKKTGLTVPLLPPSRFKEGVQVGLAIAGAVVFVAGLVGLAILIWVGGL